MEEAVGRQEMGVNLEWGGRNQKTTGIDLVWEVKVYLLVEDHLHLVDLEVEVGINRGQPYLGEQNLRI